MSPRAVNVVIQMVLVVMFTTALFTGLAILQPETIGFNGERLDASPGMIWIVGLVAGILMGGFGAWAMKGDEP